MTTVITDIIFGKTEYIHLPAVDLWFPIDILYRKTLSHYGYGNADLETTTKITKHDSSRFKDVDHNQWEDIAWDFSNCEELMLSRQFTCKVYNARINQDDIDYWESMGFVVLGKLEDDPYKDIPTFEYDSTKYYTIVKGIDTIVGYGEIANLSSATNVVAIEAGTFMNVGNTIATGDSGNPEFK